MNAVFEYMMCVFFGISNNSCFQLTVYLCNVSAEAMSVCVAAGMTKSILNELDKANNDILLQLNILQCLGEMAAGKSHCTEVCFIVYVIVNNLYLVCVFIWRNECVL